MSKKEIYKLDSITPSRVFYRWRTSPLIKDPTLTNKYYIQLFQILLKSILSSVEGGLITPSSLLPPPSSLLPPPFPTICPPTAAPVQYINSCLVQLPAIRSIPFLLFFIGGTLLGIEDIYRKV
jgi:hypothetical protein